MSKHVFDWVGTSELPRLETGRLILRHPRDDDAADLLRVFGDDETMRYWSHEPLANLEAASDYIDQIGALFAERSLFQWAIELASEQRFVGTVTLASLSEQNKRAEIGFILDRGEWGKGLATEAVRRVCVCAFEDIGLHRIEADIDPRNRPSEALLERLGFVREGLLRDRWFTYGEWSDSALYGLLSADFVGASSSSS